MQVVMVVKSKLQNQIAEGRSTDASLSSRKIGVWCLAATSKVTRKEVSSTRSVSESPSVASADLLRSICGVRKSSGANCGSNCGKRQAEK